MKLGDQEIGLQISQLNQQRQKHQHLQNQQKDLQMNLQTYLVSMATTSETTKSSM